MDPDPKPEAADTSDDVDETLPVDGDVGETGEPDPAEPEA